MRRENKSRLMILLAMAIFGTLAPFVRNISVSSGELALYRAVMAASVIGIYLAATGQKIPLGKIRRELTMVGSSDTVHLIIRQFQ